MICSAPPSVSTTRCRRSNWRQRHCHEEQPESLRVSGGAQVRGRASTTARTSDGLLATSAQQRRQRTRGRRVKLRNPLAGHECRTVAILACAVGKPERHQNEPQQDPSDLRGTGNDVQSVGEDDRDRSTVLDRASDQDGSVRSIRRDSPPAMSQWMPPRSSPSSGPSSGSALVKRTAAGTSRR